MTTPLTRALDLYRLHGYIGDEVERKFSFPAPGGKRKVFKRDFLGFGDAIVFHAEHPPVIIQATEGGGSRGQSNHNARVKKIIDNEFSARLVFCGVRIHVVSWPKMERRITSLTAIGGTATQREIDLPNDDLK